MMSETQFEDKGVQRWRCKDCKKNYPHLPWRLVGGGFSTCEYCGGDLEPYYVPRPIYQGKTWRVKVLLECIVEADDEKEAKERTMGDLFTELDDDNFISIEEIEQ